MIVRPSQLKIPSNPATFAYFANATWSNIECKRYIEDSTISEVEKMRRLNLVRKNETIEFR